MRLGILASHPIQYQAPWFRALAKKADLEVFFAHRQSAAEQGRAGFGVAFDWDVDLLSGYKHRFLENKSPRPDVNRFAGCDTPEIAEVIRGQESAVNGQGSALPRFDAFIVCGWYLKSYLQAVRACRAAGIPVLVRGDSQLRTPRPLLKRLAMEVRQRWLLRQFDGFLSVGQRHGEYLEHYDVPKEKIFFAPHFVDNEWFARRAEEVRGQRSEIRRKWGIPEDAFCALFCGKFISKKRPMDLIRALAILQSRQPNLTYHALFVGSGELGPVLRSACHVVFDAEAGQRTEVRSQRSEAESPSSALRSPLPGTKPPASFVGFKNQSELPTCYVAADVLVLPSESETWGLAVNEAMACGLPAIVSEAVGCAPDLIEEGKTGFIFPTGDCGALADRLIKLTDLKQARQPFDSALREKLNAYGVKAAVNGTLAGVRTLSGRMEKAGGWLASL